MTDWLPRARRDDLLVESVDQELLLYDLRSERAHFLSASAAAIWHASDGATSVAQLALAFVAGGDTDREALTCRILRELLERDLLDDRTDAAPHLLSRRALIEHVAIPLAMLPFVVSLSAPTPAMAQSCPPLGPQGFQGFAGPQGGCDCGPQGTAAFDAVATGPQGFQGITGPEGDCAAVGAMQDAEEPVGAAVAVDPCQGPQGPQGPQGFSPFCNPL